MERVPSSGFLIFVLVALSLSHVVQCGEAGSLDLTRSSAREIIPALPESTCIKNATHCSCMEKNYRSLIRVPEQPGRCILSDEKTGSQCSCPGTSLCERDVEPCGPGKLRATGSFADDGTVECDTMADTDCEIATEPKHCTAAVNVFVDGVLGGCIKTIPVVSDVDDAYGYASSRANNIENVEYDYINLRFIETKTNNELHFCVIYGNWRVGESVYSDDPVLSRKEKSEITAKFPLFFEIKDDPNDFYGGEGTTTVTTSHAHYAYKSDGFCLGPLLGDGSGVRANFYDLDNILGVNVQTFNEDTHGTTNLLKWNFADHRSAIDLQEDGRANGDENVVVDFQPACECGVGQP